MLLRKILLLVSGIIVSTKCELDLKVEIGGGGII